ncbi:helix-turn-helix transcriptional regulator [Streptomyces bikiniensis]|uniref:Helix-turn-helix transcriptional regulator n=1 Tax=Streptomyces bikiniensis TaxID=1896 RepID=A0ABW8CN88_STRBI
MFSGEKLRAHREKRGISRVGLAQMIGRAPLTVFRWETGRIKPNSHTVVVLAELFGCEKEDLMEPEGVKK